MTVNGQMVEVALFCGLGDYLQRQVGGVLMSWGQNDVCGMVVVFLGFG